MVLTREFRSRLAKAALILLVGAAAVASAQDAPQANEGAAASEPRFDAHFQLTTVTQAHPSFPAAYSGTNSLSPESEHETTVTSTLYLGARLWSGAEIYVNPEMTGGSGLSKAFGIAGFPNGESFRVGSPEPHVFLARVLVRQTFAAGPEMEAVPEEANQLGGRRPVRRWTLTVGKFGVTDIFDDNAYSHDPRTQFLNWADWTPGAWDYPADTRGYTWGVAAEFVDKDWAARLGATAEPRVANGLEMDKDLRHAYSLMIELERRYEIDGKEGRVKLILFENRADMGNYREAISEAGGGTPDIVAARRTGRSKYGFAVNLEQSLGELAGFFLRGSWNDGRNEAWAYAEIERSLTAGAVRKQPLPDRPDDEAGLAFIVNGLSADHRHYLAAGGYGFMIGDGKLTYGLEKIAELYYKAALLKNVWVTGNYQFVENPAYNRDRGPVHVFALRLHTEF
jgi:high affinity Mn2+ porin